MYWICGMLFQCPILAFLVENPPEAMVLMAWLMASKSGIPDKKSNRALAKVNPT